MRSQRGQSVVEFAFVIPMFALLLFGLIYGGISFLQYFNLCNDARAEARRIAVMDSTQRASDYGTATAEAPKVVTNDKRFGTFYTVQEKIWLAEGDVIVRVEFERDNKDLPRILQSFDWPPREFAMTYRMQLEAQVDSEGT